MQHLRVGDEAVRAGRPGGAPNGPGRGRLRLLVVLVGAALSACAGDGGGGGAPPGAHPGPGTSAPSPDPDAGAAPTTTPDRPGAGLPEDSETGGEPPTEGAPNSEPPTTPDLEAFLTGCELGVREWRAAQVNYPSDLSIEVGGSATYVAAVDTRATPAGPGDLIPGPSPTAEAVAVRCEVAARLSPSGAALTVDETGWVLRRFTPTGFIRWSWSVTAVKGGDHDLELELQPAVRTEDGRVLVSDSTLDISTFITRAHVDEDAIQAVGSWVDSHKGPVAVIAAALAAATIGVLRFGREFATEMRQTVTAWTGTPPDDRGGDGEDLAPTGKDPP